MQDDHVVLLPHTLSSGAVTTLRDELGRRLPDLSVRTPATPDETHAAFDDATILITMGFEEAWYDHLDSIAWIQGLSAGVDHIDLDRVAEADTVLTNASGVHAKPIAQQVLGYLLAFERNLHRAIRQQSRGVWERFHGSELGDKTVGIIGVGAIGSEVARVLEPFETTVIGTKRDTSETVPHVDRLYPPAGTDEVLVEADYLVLACPLTDETRGLIDAEKLRLLSNEAVLVNIARGQVVDEDALVTALQQGRLRGAALDVFETEPLPADSTLWSLSNVILTPHMAGSTPHYWRRCADLVEANYPAVADGSLEGLRNRLV